MKLQPPIMIPPGGVRSPRRWIRTGLALVWLLASIAVLALAR